MNIHKVMRWFFSFVLALCIIGIGFGLSGCQEPPLTRPTVMPPSKAYPQPVTTLFCPKDGSKCYRIYMDGTRTYEEHYGEVR